MVVTVVVAQYIAAMNCATAVSSVRSWPAAQHHKESFEGRLKVCRLAQ
jgi:hypothetical protein